MELNLDQHKYASPYFLLDCEKFEDYLDAFRTVKDLRFLRDIRLCRKIVELGYRSTVVVYTPKQFEIQKQRLFENLQPTKGQAVLYGVHLKSNDRFLNELAAREQLNYQKVISTIIFLTHRNQHGFEVSGFIDFEASLRQRNLKLDGSTDWQGVFEEKVKLCPKSTDLSFFSTHEGVVRYNNSENYVVQHDIKHGLTFMHRGDHKKVFVDKKKHKNEKVFLRSKVYSTKYGYTIFFDRVLRKKI